MKISKEVQAQARRLMRLCIGTDGLMNEATVRQVAAKIAADKPRNYLALLTAFTELVRLERAAHTATSTSAVPLTEAEQAAIAAKLDARQAGLSYEWQVDPTLIAGLTVKVGDNVTDASVRTRIEQLTKNL
jgi:F-type H+-transporting ATPase subunit delta